MANIIYYDNRVFGHSSSTGSTVPYVTQKIVDFARVYERKGSALAEGDIIEVFKIPEESLVAFATIKVTEVADSTSLSLDFGDEEDPDEYVSGLDGKVLGYAPNMNADPTFQVKPNGGTLNLTISELTGTLTAGKVVVTMMAAGLNGIAQREQRRPEAPQNITPPTFDGDEEVGGTLEATVGEWTDGSISRLWQRSADSTSGWLNVGSGKSYIIQPEDVGQYIRYIEIATSGSVSASVSTTPIGPIADPTPEIEAPENLIAPGISGLAGIGNVIVGSRGVYTDNPTSYSDQYQRSNNGVSNWGPIPSATSLNYTQTADDYNQYIRRQEVAFNSAGSSEPSYTTPIGPVPGVSPTMSTSPTITGTSRVGETLTLTNGTASGIPTPTINRQLERSDDGSTGWAEVSGGTGTTYVIAAGDYGKYFRLRNIATSAAGTSSASYSSVTAVVAGLAPVKTSDPSLSGTPNVSSVLTLSNGSFTGTPAPTITRSYEISLNGSTSWSTIAGESGATYTPVADDLTKYIRGVNVASNGIGSDITAYTSVIGPIQEAVGADLGIVQKKSGRGTTATVSGLAFDTTPTDGNTLILIVAADDYDTGIPSGWNQRTGMSQETYCGSYLWDRVASGGTNSFSYQIGSAAPSQWILLELSGVDASSGYLVSAGQLSIAGTLSYSTPSITPAANDVILIAAFGASKPSVNFSGNMGSWNNSFTHEISSGINNGTVFAAAGSRIVTANGSTSYSTTATFPANVDAETGMIIAFKKGAGGGGGGGDIPVNSVTPTNTGTATVNQQLSGSRGTYSNSPTSYSDQWERSDNGSTNWSNIAGATSINYTLTTDDFSKYVRRREVATNAHGSSAPAYTSNSGPIAGIAPVNTEAPVISGTSQEDSVLTVANGTYTGIPNPTITRQWQWSDGSDPSGSWTNLSDTDNSYTPNSGDVGRYISVLETATNAAGAPTTRSNIIGPITALPVIPVGGPPTFVAWRTPTFPGGANWASKAVSNTGSTGNFDVQTNDVLGVIVGAEDYTFRTHGDPSGGSLTYTSRQSVEVSDFAHSEVYSAVSDGDKSMAISMITSSSGYGNPQSNATGFVAAQFRDSDGVGASAKANASGTPTLNITTEGNRSAVLVLITDWNAAATTNYAWRSVNSIIPSTVNGFAGTPYRNSQLYTVYWAYYPDVGDAGTKTVGLSAPAGQKYSIVALEIKGVNSVPPPAAPTNVSVPTVTGTSSVGGTLTTSNGLWNGYPTPAVSARVWQYSTDGVGSADGTISGATDASYTIHSDYEDMWIRSGVTVTNSEGTSSPAYSAWIGPIAGTGSGDFPTLSSTGVRPGITRTNHTGSNTISSSNGTYQNLNFSGQVTVTGSNNKFINCQFTYSSFWGVLNETGTGNEFDYCTFVGPGTNGSTDSSILIGTGGTVKRCQTSGSENGIRVGGNNVTIRDNYIYSQRTSRVDPHSDGIALHGANNTVLIEHNTVISWSNACIFLKCDFGLVQNVTINNNLLLKDGVLWGSGYPFRNDGANPNYPPPQNTVVTNNVIQRGEYGYWILDGTVTRSGNKDYVTGNPI